MSYVLFIVYVMAGWWLLSTCSFVKRSGLSRTAWTFGYCLKISAGVAVGWLSAYYSPEGSDYWMIHRESLINYEMLKESPVAFFTELFSSPYGHYSGYFDSVGSYWTDLKNNLVIKTAAIVNLFSGGNYYVNSVFFNVPGFLAHIAIYRMFRRFYPQHSSALFIGAFLLPSALYFSSGIHKDAFLFIGVAGLMYASITPDKINTKKRWMIFGSLVLIALVRSYVLAALIPAILAYRLSVHYRQSLSYFFVYTLVLEGALWAHFYTSFSPVKIITQKQQAFLALPEARSQIALDTLHGNGVDLITAFPQAASNVTTQPRWWEDTVPNSLIIPSLEWYAYLLVLGIGLIFYRRNKLPLQPLFTCLLFVLPLLLLIGYIVPNSGSIVRYRALYLPYLIPPFLVASHILIKRIRFNNI